MSVTRDNHYVPQWYQKGFFEPGRKSLAYLDMTPDQKVLPDGHVITPNGVWNNTPTSRAFFQTDLYSTFFGTSVNDEIERRLFGNVDARGSQAIRAFIGTDVREWHDHLQDFFDFLDIQKIRTPEGFGLAQGSISCPHAERIDARDATNPHAPLRDLGWWRSRDCFCQKILK